MDIEFRKLAKFMERADRQVNGRMYEQELLARSRGMLFNSGPVLSKPKLTMPSTNTTLELL